MCSVIEMLEEHKASVQMTWNSSIRPDEDILALGFAAARTTIVVFCIVLGVTHFCRTEVLHFATSGQFSDTC